MKLIDLRSDTVTKPTPQMREAMIRAEVGDDVYGEDPTVNALEAKAAAMFGREAAIFFPTGTMANQCAIRVLTDPGQEILGEERCHVFNYEMGAAAAISGVLAKPVRAPDGILDPVLLDPYYAPPGIPYRSQTGGLIIENTGNLAGGTYYSVGQWRAILEWARARELPVHLDGARIFNASVAQGVSVRELTDGATTVMFSLSKGLSAPVGSMLVGDAEVCRRARRVRKMLGGGMRQAGILAAAAIVSLDSMIDRLADDHARARSLAEGLASIDGVDIDRSKVMTNILIFRIPGTETSDFLRRLREHGVLAGSITANAIRMVTHKDIEPDDVATALEAVAKALRERT